MKLGEYSFYILVTAILIIVRINKNVEASEQNRQGQREVGGNYPTELTGKRNGSLSGLSGDNGPGIYKTVSGGGSSSHHIHGNYTPPVFGGRRNGSLIGLSGDNGPGIYKTVSGGGSSSHHIHGNYTPPVFGGRRNGSLSGLSGDNGQRIYITVSTSGPGSHHHHYGQYGNIHSGLYGRRYGSLKGLSIESGQCIYITVNAGKSSSYQHQYYPTRSYGRRYGTLSGLSGEKSPRIHVTVCAGGSSSNKTQYFPTRLYGPRYGTLSGLSGNRGPNIHKIVNASRSSSYHKKYGQQGNVPPRLSVRRNGSLSGLYGGKGPSIHLTFNSDGQNSTDHDLKQGVTSPPRLSGRKYMKGRSIEYMFEKVEEEVMNATHSTSGEDSSFKNNRNDYYNKRLSNKAGGKRYKDIFSSRSDSIFDDIDSEASTFQYGGKITKYGKRNRKDSDSIPTIGSLDRYASSYITDNFKIKAKSKKKYGKDHVYGTYKSKNKRGGRKTNTETTPKESRNKTKRKSSQDKIWEFDVQL